MVAAATPELLLLFFSFVYGWGGKCKWCQDAPCSRSTATTSAGSNIIHIIPSLFKVPLVKSVS